MAARAWGSRSRENWCGCWAAIALESERAWQHVHGHASSSSIPGEGRRRASRDGSVAVVLAPARRVGAVRPAAESIRQGRDDRERLTDSNASSWSSRTTRRSPHPARSVPRDGLPISGRGHRRRGLTWPAIHAQRDHPRRRAAGSVGPDRARPAQARRPDATHPGSCRLGERHAQTALSLGAVGYMIKPVNREQLAEVLQSSKRLPSACVAY